MQAFFEVGLEEPDGFATRLLKKREIDVGGVIELSAMDERTEDNNSRIGQEIVEREFERAACLIVQSEPGFLSFRVALLEQSHAPESPFTAMSASMGGESGLLDCWIIGLLDCCRMPGSKKPLRVAIDAHAIGSRLGGNETYIRDVLGSLGRFPQHQFFLYVNDSAAVDEARRLCPSAAAIRTIGRKNPLYRLGYKLPVLASLDRADVLHVQYTAPLWSPAALVATIHDISFMHHPEWFSRGELLQFRLTIPWTARRARRVLTISDYSRRDMIETFRLPPEKVSFSHLALRSIFTPRPPTEIDALTQRLGVRQPYILALGNLQPRKNLERLIAAWAQIRRTEPDFSPQLVLVGKKAWNFEEILGSAGRSEFANDVVFTGYLPDEELPVILSGAKLFVYPSLFEGFGYPLWKRWGVAPP